MKGEITRSTFQRHKHYSSVRMQQGRVQLDADWNEQIEIAAHRDHTKSYDIIGASGVAQMDNGFSIQWTSGKRDLVISPGRMYVHGILCELEATPIGITEFLDTNRIVVDSLVVDGRPLRVGEWVSIYADGVPPLWCQIAQVDLDRRSVQFQPAVQPISGVLRPEFHRLTTYLTQPDLPKPEPAELTDGTYLVYLDVWQRHITAIEDPNIREVALGGPDTATRTQTVWQVKLFSVPDETRCWSDLQLWQEQIAPSSGRLSARAEPKLDSADPCIVVPGAGYGGLENQLYRVEIHEGGSRNDKATWKWSRDNGAIVALCTDQSGASDETLEVQPAGKDVVSGLRSGDWVEVTDDANELHGEPGTLVRLDVHFVSSLPVMQQPVYRAWVDTRPMQISWVERLPTLDLDVVDDVSD